MAVPHHGLVRERVFSSSLPTIATSGVGQSVGLVNRYGHLYLSSSMILRGSWTPPTVKGLLSRGKTKPHF